jgi:undecaprenyl-phosphate 4-deoxy-4-formamido-L-arabinose transferase
MVNVLVLYSLGRIQVAGFTTLVALLTAFSGAMMLSVGILGEYLGRLHFRSMEKPTYLVRIDSRQDAPNAGVPRLTPTATQQGQVPDDVREALVGDWLESRVRDGRRAGQ